MSARHWFAAVVGLVASIPCCAAAPPPGHEFRVTGVVVSARDGSPVSRCRITASAVPQSQIGTAKTPVGNGPARGMQPNNGRGGPGGGQGGGRPASPGAGRQTTALPPEAIADSSGRFTLDLPRAGAWLLSATARGFRTQNYDEHEGFYSAVVLTDAAPAFDLTYKLTPDSILTGLIYDESGEPVAQAQVSAELVPEPVPGSPASADEGRPRPVGFSQTDDRGRYEMGGLQPGKYLLRVQAQPWYAVGHNLQAGTRTATGITTVPPPDPSLDLVYPTTWFPGVDDKGAAETIVLKLGEERQADFHLTAIPAIHLRIPGPEQTATAGNQRNVPRPMQQRPLTISRVNGDQASNFEGQQQASLNGGTWDFGGLIPGTYEVHIPGSDPRSEGEVRQIEVRDGSQTIVTLDNAKPLVAVTVRFETAGHDMDQVEFVDTETGRRISSNAQMRGRRGGFDGPPEDDDSSDEPPASATRTVMLPARTYAVFVGGGAGDYLTAITAVGAKALGREVTIGGAATLTLRVAKTHAVVEGVARLGGKAAEGAMILLVPATLGMPGDLTEILRDESNTDGTFLVNGVVPGRYILVAIDHGWNVEWRRPEVLAQYLVHGTPVDLRTAAKSHEEVTAVAP